MNTTAIILAAGQGKRMNSARPKVLHPLCGRPMLDYVVAAALEAGASDAVVVVGHERELVQSHLAATFGDRVRTTVQEQQRGTGHAVQCGLTAVPERADAALLLYGDTPLVESATLAQLSAARDDRPLSLLSCRLDDPAGYGRILRDDSGQICAIREQRDCDPSQSAINEVNPGMYLVDCAFLRAALQQLTPDNDQGELYLTDIVALAHARGGVVGVDADSAALAGINDRAQLARAEATMHDRLADALRQAGATIRASARIDWGVAVAPDAVIEHGVVLRGATTIGTAARVDVGCVLDGVTVEERAYLKPYSVCCDSVVRALAQVGPFTHLRPDSDIGPEARVGNFVETKKTRLARGAKANHLAYLGDGEIGERANVGAGTIFCNYDGFQKHKTVIEQDAFIGSDSQIVAPVTVGKGAYVATGTTVTKDVPSDGLAIARVRQENKEGYASRLKSRLQRQAAKRKALEQQDLEAASRAKK